MVQNFLTTDIVSEWAWANGAKLIYSSSAASYGTNGDHPSNLYGWSKYTAERAVLARGGIGLRYFNVYGPGEQNKARMASFAFQACMKFAEGEDVRLFPGEPKRDFVHVSDVVTANLFAAERYDEFSGQRFDVGTGVASSFESVLTTLGIPWGYYEETDIPKGYQSFTRAKPENFMPGWGPRVFIEDGMSRYRSQLDGDLG
jgi:ADP-L-glycero-D-manno-heptose 6-epimerase